MNRDIYLKETKILDFSSTEIQNLITEREWKKLDEYNKIKGIYNFVRNEIRFGYNIIDNLSATEVLKDGFGQCNTKATLLTALLRGVGIPCRLHASTIHKKLQKGILNKIIYPLTPTNILHSWVEVLYNGKWHSLEGVILDEKYLTAIQNRFPEYSGSFMGYGVGVKDFRNPPVNWNGNSTYIQSEAVNNDLGIYSSPDEMYNEHSQNMNRLKLFLYQYLARHIMNRTVERIKMKYK